MRAPSTRSVRLTLCVLRRKNSRRSRGTKWLRKRGAAI
jgi:hypothetical protein